MPQQARAEEHWWYDPKYIIRDLNVNSAIVYPANGEELDVSGVTTAESFPIRGYAYSGGGKRVNRIEVSLDEGESWTKSDIT